MLFYRCAFSPEKEMEKEQEKEYAETLREETERFNDTGNGKEFFFLSSLKGRSITACCARPTESRGGLREGFEAFFRALNCPGQVSRYTEITLREFRELVNRADHNDLANDDDLFIKLGLDELSYGIFRRDAVSEILLPPVLAREDALREAHVSLLGKAFIEELARIYDGPDTERYYGHPVHYMTEYANPDLSAKARDLLMGALQYKGRLPGRRCCIVNLSADRPCDIEDLYQLYAIHSGCSILLRVAGRYEEHNTVSKNAMELALESMSFVRRFRREVLTLIELSPNNGELADKLIQELGAVPLLRFRADPVDDGMAAEYLMRRAEVDGYAHQESLRAKILPGRTYSPGELEELYCKWSDAYIRTEIYPGYRDLALLREDSSRPKGNAAERLYSLIGLTEAKKALGEIVDFHKARKLLSARGLNSGNPAMHMVFRGNPGTAKTTAARLFAEILRDNGVLSEGRLIEVGRADLVGKYVGWTAQIVKKKFMEARGSVLFIDEAYSLLDDRGGMYGDEAINTIVQEMENAREDTVVIFAGYPDEMADFVARNPGLRSRIAFHVDFPDYTPDELMEIFALILRNLGRCADEGAVEKVRNILISAANASDFGNGRYVRNLVERALMRQASRLMRLEADSVSTADAQTLTADDFEAMFTPAPAKAIGFC